MTSEDPAQRLGTAQPAARRNDVEGVRGLLELAAGRLQASALDETARSLADLGREDPGEVAHAHRGRRGERREAVVTPGGGFDEGLHRADGRALGAGHPDRRGELGLAPRAVQEHHQPTGHRLGHVNAQVLLDQRQREVDPRRDPGARPVLPVADVDRVGVDRQRGIGRTELVGAGPVGGDAPSVEQARRRTEEGARAHRRDPAAAWGGVADPADQELVTGGGVGAVAAGQHQGVDALGGPRERTVPSSSPLSARTGPPAVEARVTR